jgi:type IV secretion system protein VirB3
MMEQEPTGFRVPIHRSLIEPVMMGGIPRNIALLNGFATFSLVMGAHNLWVLPLGIISHLVLMALYRRDKHILAIIKANLSRPSYLRA